MTQRNSDSTVVSTKTSVLSYLFFQGKFEVPWHQRYYDWSQEHVIELLQDLEEASVQDQKCYFLGTILLVEKQNGIWEINDGQQRMVTYSLICARLAREFTNGSDSLREAQALRVLFSLNETHTMTLSETDEIDPRLTPPRNDSNRYKQLIRGNNIGTNGKLTTAWTVVNGFLSNFETEKAKTFFDFIMNKLEVACLYVPREIDPNLVFETLNARGKPLGSLDLIRNHFYSFFSDESEQPRRDTVHENLEQLRILLREDKKSRIR